MYQDPTGIDGLMGRDRPDARAYLRGVLESYGLGSEVDWAWSQIRDNVSEVEILQNLRTRDAYRTRFRGLELRRQQGYTPITEGEYVSLERRYRQIMQAAGLPDEFMTQDYLAAQIGYDRSPDELQAVVDNAYRAVVEAPASVRETFYEFFGTQGDTALASLMLDPDLAETAAIRMAQTARVGGAARDAGFQIGRGLAEQVVARNPGSDVAGVFQALGERRSLFDETVTENTDLDADTGVAAAFGLDADSADAVRRRAERRQAEFGGRTETVMTERGMIGLGAAGQ